MPGPVRNALWALPGPESTVGKGVSRVGASPLIHLCTSKQEIPRLPEADRLDWGHGHNAPNVSIFLKASTAHALIGCRGCSLRVYRMGLGLKNRSKLESYYL